MPQKSSLSSPILPPWQIRLSVNAQSQTIVAPVAANGQTQLEPFALPPIALSNTIWLSNLTESMYARHRRCMGIWLVLDCKHHCWLRPIIPHQQCAADGAAWRLEQRDLTDLSATCRLGGTFQMCQAAGMQEASGAVPRLDGLHFVLGMGQATRTLYLFIHSQERTECVSPEDLVIDDWQHALNIHRQQLAVI